MLLMAGCASSSSKESDSLSDGSDYLYQFEISRCDLKPCLKATFIFRPTETLTSIQLPTTNIGKEIHALQHLVAITPGTDLKPTQKPDVYELKAKVSTPVKLQYELLQDFTSALDEESNYYRPIINENYFHVFGEGLLIYPSSGRDQVRNIRLTWKVPSDYQIINSFGAISQSQNISTSVEALHEGTFLGGKTLRISHKEIRGNPVWIAMIGKQGVSDEAFSEVLTQIISTERSFWHDQNFPYYFVSALSVSTEGESVGGQGRTNGFASFTWEKLDLPWLQTLLAHELFHTWNGHKIKQPENEFLTKWFSEGFTDYYAHLIPLRAKLINLPEYLNLFNKTIRKYELSESKNATLNQVKEGFWKTQSLQKLPYQQGEIIAQLWNAEMKNKSHGRLSLDEYMKEILTQSQTKTEPISAYSRLKTASSFLKRDPTSQIESQVEKGETISFNVKKLGPCVALKEIKTPTYNPGFLVKESWKAKTMIGVVVDGAAYQAGLRNGMPLTNILVTRGDPDQKVLVQIKTGASLQDVMFFPKGKPIFIPQYILDEKKYLKTPSLCTRYFLSHD